MPVLSPAHHGELGEREDVCAWMRKVVLPRLECVPGSQEFAVPMNGFSFPVVQEVAAEIAPTLSVWFDGLSRDAVFRRTPLASTHRQLRYPEATMVYDLDAIVGRQLYEYRHRLGALMDSIEPSDWSRRVKGRKRDGRLGAAGEVMLDAIVRRLVEDLATLLPRAQVKPIVPSTVSDRADFTHEARKLLRTQHTIDFAHNGVFLYHRGQSEGEYENGLVVSGRQGQGFLFLDATMGNGSGKGGKAENMRQHAVRENRRDTIAALSVSFSETDDDVRGRKVVLPFRRHICGLLADDRN